MYPRLSLSCLDLLGCASLRTSSDWEKTLWLVGESVLVDCQIELLLMLMNCDSHFKNDASYSKLTSVEVGKVIARILFDLTLISKLSVPSPIMHVSPFPFSRSPFLSCWIYLSFLSATSSSLMILDLSSAYSLSLFLLIFFSLISL